ncbi:MAG: hypothetical protein MHM6MM_002202 [Cercozoa sp. M6MM]
MKLLTSVLALAQLCSGEHARFSVQGTDAQALVQRAMPYAEVLPKMELAGNGDLIRADDSDSVEVIVELSDKLNKQAIQSQLSLLGLESQLEEISRPFSQIQAERQEHAAPVEGYHSPLMLLREFQKLEVNYQGKAAQAKLHSVQEEFDVPKTIQGNEVLYLRVFAPKKNAAPKHNVVVVSNHHSRELVTPEIILDTATRLLEDYIDGKQWATLTLDHQDIYFIWTLNPDGLNEVWSSNNMHRKNMRSNSDGSLGVDLNRNYHVGWDATCAGSTVPRSETYRGTSALSEVETQGMVKLQQHLRPVKVLDFHSYAREVRINYGTCIKLPGPIDNMHWTLAGLMADSIRDYRSARSCCLGGNIHQAYHDHGALSFLVETATAFQPPSDLMREEVRRLRKGTEGYLSLPPTFRGRLVSKSGDIPDDVTVKISVAECDEADCQKFDWPMQEAVGGVTKDGAVHVWLDFDKQVELEFDVCRDSKCVSTIVEMHTAGHADLLTWDDRQVYEIRVPESN